MGTADECIALGNRLEELLGGLRIEDTPATWSDIENTAQALANGLRVKDANEDTHSLLGRTSLPQTLTVLLSLALHGAPIPDAKYTAVVLELLRVGANLCMDHDENRGFLLEAGLPQAIVTLLEGYTESIPPPPYREPISLDISHMKVARTAIGVLLNASLGYDPVKFRLMSLEAAMTMMKLSAAIYPSGSWLQPTTQESQKQEPANDVWLLRAELSNWVWRTISELGDTSGRDDSPQIFNPDVLPLLVPSLQAFLSSGGSIPSSIPASTASTLLNADFDSLEESCTLLESLALDVEDVRLSLARGLTFPAEHGGVPCLSAMLDFIEKSGYPSTWYQASVLDESDIKRKEKAFDICKAAVIKAVVEVAGEERNDDVLWDDSEADKPGGEFICRMVEWVKKYVAVKELPSSEQPAGTIDRDDLAICACLSLGNLARRGNHATVLLSAPHSLAPVLSSPHLLSPDVDIKLKHGVVGLLKNLAQSSSPSSLVHEELGKAGLVGRVARSGIWDQKVDAMSDIVQISAIGVVKHLCNASVENTYSLVLPSDDLPQTGLTQILALVKRTESIAVRSEGTRVLVNVIKSLWSGDVPVTSTSDDAAQDDVAKAEQKKRRDAIRNVLTQECASALASLVGRSGKYPLLVNEGVVALSLLSTQRAAGPLVLTALTEPLPVDATPPTMPISSADSTASTSESSAMSSPLVATPPGRPRLPVLRHTLDMLKGVLKNVDNPANFPIEVRINVCSLLLQLTKSNTPEDLLPLKETLRPTLEKLAEKLASAQGKEEMFCSAIRTVLDSWA
ncbi:hypothetical protein HGRIS_013108 [Hohenbuehelia grisea]|uniref:ARM repeat-containing protein n=1 Tax=Hohenbuehelia grisea TaxID=104357 RepID=A0ABR3IUK5_9AGAR